MSDIIKVYASRHVKTKQTMADEFVEQMRKEPEILQ